MPELPEVETTRRGLLPHVRGRRIRSVVVRNGSLRWPVPRDLAQRLKDSEVLEIRRRGKYLLFDTARGHLLVHLGMSGKLSMVAPGAPAKTHDHIDLTLDGPRMMRFTDPRRFGAMLWLESPAESHMLLKGLGLEPLSPEFTGAALRERAGGRRVAVKQFLMNGRIVVGVGNIYASEALWQAKVSPLRSAGSLSAARWERVAEAVRATLERAIVAGGSTLRDFAGAEGGAGHYQNRFAVYGRAGKPCKRCQTPIRSIRQGQRSTFYCPRCQR
jgi:formamidopyrimidine-DNA glycosylase